jgi:hypothetical protein
VVVKILQITRRDGSVHDVLLDDADYARVVAAGPWAILTSHGNTYALHSTNVDGKRTVVLMHRFVLGVDDSVQVDHENSNGLDNQRGNLRPATRVQNAQNRRRNKNSTTGFKGVVLDRRTGLYRARIAADGRRVSLGAFATASAAHEAYCSAAARLHGTFARTV